MILKFVNYFDDLTLEFIFSYTLNSTVFISFFYMLAKLLKLSCFPTPSSHFFEFE